MIQKRKLYTGFVLTITLVLLYGCIDTDFDKKSEVLTPNYSLPLGSTKFSMKEMVDEYPGTLIPVSTTDSGDVFNYLGINHNSPNMMEYVTYDEFSFNSITNNFDYITSLMIRTNITNAIPGRLEMQVYFQSDQQVVYSLFSDGPLEVDAISTNNDGIVNESPKLQQTDTWIDDNTIDRFYYVNTLRIVTRLYVSDFNNTQIKYLPEQNIGIQLGIRVGLSIPVDEF